MSAAGLSDDQLASIAVRLAMSFPDWVERRIEHVIYLDDTTLRLRESVTFRWPQPDFFVAEARPAAGQTVYVPLDVLKKQPLIADIDTAREDDSSFPILSTRRTREIAASGITSAIWYQSQKRKGKGLEDQTVERIDTAVKAPAARAAELLTVLDDKTTELGHVLGRRDQIRGLLEELAGNALLLAPATYRPGVETLLKYSYSHRLPWKLSVRNVASRFGLADFRSELTDLALGYGESYHVEVAAPEEVRLARARLFGSYVDSTGSHRVTVLIGEDRDSPVVDLHARRPTQTTLDAAEAFKAEPRWKRILRRAPRAAPPPKLALAAAKASRPSPAQRSDQGFAQISLRPRISGAFIAAVVTSLLTSALLLGARKRLPELDGQVGSAVLLALPVLAAGYLTRSGEHRFATRLLSGVRFSALVVGICSLVVAAALGGGFIEHGQPQPRLICSAVRGGPRLARARQLRCVTPPQSPPATKTPHGVHLAVDWATWVAVGMSGLLVAGLMRTWLASAVRFRKRAPAP